MSGRADVRNAVISSGTLRDFGVAHVLGNETVAEGMTVASLMRGLVARVTQDETDMAALRAEQAKLAKLAAERKADVRALQAEVDEAAETVKRYRKERDDALAPSGGRTGRFAYAPPPTATGYGRDYDYGTSGGSHRLSDPYAGGSYDPYAAQRYGQAGGSNVTQPSGKQDGRGGYGSGDYE